MTDISDKLFKGKLTEDNLLTTTKRNKIDS